VIALILEAVSTPETSVNFYQTTRRYNPEDSHLYTHRRENLKSRKTHEECEQACPGLLISGVSFQCFALHCHLTESVSIQAVSWNVRTTSWE
jgi:hypothetical protein